MRRFSLAATKYFQPDFEPRVQENVSDSASSGKLKDKGQGKLPKGQLSEEASDVGTFSKVYRKRLDVNKKIVERFSCLGSETGWPWGLVSL